MLLSRDIPGAAGTPAIAGMLVISFQIIAVIIEDLFLFLDVPQGNDPYMAPDYINFTIRRTGMVDELGCIVIHMPVNIVFLIEHKYINSPHLLMLQGIFDQFGPPPLCFGLGYFFSNVFDDTRTFGNIGPGEYPKTMDT